MLAFFIIQILVLMRYWVKYDICNDTMLEQ